MVALIVLLLLLALFGGLGFAAHVLWYVLIIAVVLWLLGFFVGGAADGGHESNTSSNFGSRGGAARDIFFRAGREEHAYGHPETRASGKFLRFICIR